MKDLMQTYKKELLFLTGIFFLLLLCSILQPFNSAPDEYMRYQICEFIYENKSLPHGGDPSIRNPIWGYSYAFYPILEYMVGAVFMMVASLLSNQSGVLLMAARMVSILLGVGTVWIVINIGKSLFERSYRYFFIASIVFLPQFLYLFTYVNNDSLALFATALILYMWILGEKSGWSRRHCFGLAIGISLCALSYYNAYGVILCSIFFFVGTILYSEETGKWNAVITKGMFISSIVLLCIGWWFFRNYILYDGDFLGMKTGELYSQMYGANEWKPSNRMTPYVQGMNVFEMLLKTNWLKVTSLSFVGCFGYMEYPLYLWMYLLLGLVFFVGLCGVLVRFRDIFIRELKQKSSHTCLLHWCMLLAVIIPNFLNLYHSYIVDYEPQGRYSMPMLIPFMYFVTMGWQKIMEKKKVSLIWEKRIIYGMIGVIVGIYVISYCFVLLPSYAGK